MTSRLCPREGEVLHLVTIGQWPRQAGADLASHATSCDACGEVLLVSAALQAIDHDGAAGDVLPEAGVVWQRAQWQARQEAMRHAARPVVAVQGIVALGVVAMIAAGVLWLVFSLMATGELADLTGGLRAARDSFATSMSELAALVAVDVPASAMWTVVAAVGLGTTVVGLAIGLSTLADLQSDPPARR